MSLTPLQLMLMYDDDMKLFSKQDFFALQEPLTVRQDQGQTAPLCFFQA
jgi:hypothetical protein